MPQASETRLVTVINRVAVAVALLTALVIPGGYGTLSYQNLAYRAEVLARVKADAITVLISSNPSFWRFEHLRIEELLTRHPEPLADYWVGAYDARGDEIQALGMAQSAPVLLRTAPLYDSGHAVGQVDIAISLRPLLFETALAALMGLVLGALVLVVLRAWPTRALRQMTVALQAERKSLAASEERLRILFNRASEGILLLSPEGRIVACNDAFARNHGYSKGEMLALDVRALDTPATRARIGEHMSRLLSGEAVTFEVEHYRKDGSLVPLEVSASLVSSEEGPLIQAFHRDISDRKRAEAERDRLEQQLRQSQKMEALGTLAGGIAHDFNNALAAIFGNLELARQDLDPGHAATESLEEIARATRRAMALVQQILAFARRQPLELRRIALGPVVEEAARLLRTSLPPGIQLNVHCDAAAPEVMADPIQVQQIVLNLGNNAWQAIRGARESGQAVAGNIEIKLTAHQAGLSGYSGPERRVLGKRIERRPGHYALLRVSDDGPGMDTLLQQRIFEPFFTTKKVGEGSGLGLAVVHGIVQTHQASIELQSAPGRGTHFSVYFAAAADQTNADTASRPGPEVDPAARPTNAAAGPHAFELEGLGMHVLLIDDDEAIAYMMQRLLERRGYRVSIYTEGEAAIAAVRTRPGMFDLAVTDYNMPTMSGIEVATELRDLRPDLPVVIASGDLTEELRAQAPAAGVRQLIYKPNTVDELCESIARIARELRVGGRHAH